MTETLGCDLKIIIYIEFLFILRPQVKITFLPKDKGGHLGIYLSPA